MNMKRYQSLILAFGMIAGSVRAADSPSAKPLYSLAPGTRWSYEETQELSQVMGTKTNAAHVTGTENVEILPAPAHYRVNGDTVLSRASSQEQRVAETGTSTSSGGTMQILEWRGGDLYLHGVRVWVDGSYSEDMNLYQPPLLYLESSARPGEVWTVGKQKNMGIDLSTTATMEAPETVTVPAGTFSNCLKVVYLSTVENLPNKARLEDGSVQDTVWYAKDVGMVQESQVSHITYVTTQGRIFDRQEYRKVLKSHSSAK
jgi:hypothetical protein